MKKARTGNKRTARTGKEPSKLLLGSWKLVSYEQVLPSGRIKKPFGNAPSGMIVYQPDGHMSAQLSVGKPARLSSNDFFHTSGKQAAKAWRNYFGYWGSFRVDAKKSVVIHRVEGGSFPNWIGTEQVRHFRFPGPNRLILETQFAAGSYTVTWRRARSRQPR